MQIPRARCNYSPLLRDGGLVKPNFKDSLAERPHRRGIGHSEPSNLSHLWPRLDPNLKEPACARGHWFTDLRLQRHPQHHLNLALRSKIYDRHPSL